MVSINNPINSTVGASNSGVTNTFTVTNSSNTASSAARETITVGGASAADPTLNFNVSGTTDWEMGIDNSVSDNLTISQSTSLGTNDVWRMNKSGARTMPLQPAFLAYNSVNETSVTGDNTIYTITFDSKLYDRGNNFAANTFTAPVTGVYCFGALVVLLNISPANISGGLILQTTSAQYVPQTCNYANLVNGAGDLTVQFALNTLMNAGDTAVVQVQVGGGAKNIDVVGTANKTVFFGYLIS